MPLASFADDLTRFGATIGAGAAAGAFFGFVLGVFAMAWIGRAVPLERWALWGSGLGGVFGLAALAYDG
jgi:predicted alpha/beta superfamily hydrolase